MYVWSSISFPFFMGLIIDYINLEKVKLPNQFQFDEKSQLHATIVCRTHSTSLLACLVLSYNSTIITTLWKASEQQNHYVCKKKKKTSRQSWKSKCCHFWTYFLKTAIVVLVVVLVNDDDLAKFVQLTWLLVVRCIFWCMSPVIIP